MKHLTEQEVIKILREEYDQRRKKRLLELDMFIQDLAEEDDETKEGEPVGEPVVSPDLKVRHRESKLLYTVDSVNPKFVVLKSPEGRLFQVSEKDFDKDYVLD